MTALFWFVCLSCLSQTAKIDSLKRRLYSSSGDASRLHTMLDLFAEDESLPRDTLWEYVLKARNWAITLHDKRSLSLTVLAQADAYLRRDNADSAKALIESELAKYHVKDAVNRDVYFKLARERISYLDYGDHFKDATAEAFSLIREAEAYKDSVVVASCLNSLSAWSYDMDFVDEARRYSYQALASTSSTPPFYSVLASICFNLGENYKWIKRLDSAEYFINLGMDYGRRLDNLYYQSFGLQKMAAIEIEKEHYPGAEKDILESMRLIEKVDGDRPNLGKVIVLANVYRNWNKADKAIAVLNDGLYRDSVYRKTAPHHGGEDASLMQRMFTYDLLGKCYRDIKDHQHYAQILEKTIAAKDTIYKLNSAAALAELQTKYEVEKKEATIARQRLALIQDRYLFYASLVFVFLSGTIVWLLFKYYRRKQGMRLQRLQDEEKLLAAQAVAAAEEAQRRRISADLHDNLGAQLSFIKRNVNFILDHPEGFDAEDERKYLGYVNDTAQNAMIDLRETIWVLNRDQVDIQEFADKLKSYLRQQLQGRYMIRWNFSENLRKSWKFSSGEVMHLFRIVQELISNVIKHANADEISILFEGYEQGVFRLEIKDNGRGFDVNGNYEGHYGIENIQQRAREIEAQLSLQSDPVDGTRVVLERSGIVQNNTFELLEGVDKSVNIVH